MRDYHHVLGFDSGVTCIHPFITLSGRDLCLKAGYAWDGASGPTWDTKSSMRGSLVHDAGYQLMRNGLVPREQQFEWDNELERVCIEDGMWRVRASIWERMVNRFGGRNTEKPREVLIAP